MERSSPAARAISRMRSSARPSRPSTVMATSPGGGACVQRVTWSLEGAVQEDRRPPSSVVPSATNGLLPNPIPSTFYTSKAWLRAGVAARPCAFRWLPAGLRTTLRLEREKNKTGSLTVGPTIQAPQMRRGPEPRLLAPPRPAPAAPPGPPPAPPPAEPPEQHGERISWSKKLVNTLRNI